VCAVPANAVAQETERSPFLADIAKQVILDPTTYAPAIIAYDGTMRDWKTSQPFFRNGFLEANRRYTVSGWPYDVPLSYSDGNRRIFFDALTNLEVSVLNNATARVFERLLIERYPNHRKMVRTLGWIERVSFGVGMSYVLSAQHYRQADLNAQRAAQLGYR
jgi:hypothetical protein